MPEENHRACVIVTVRNVSDGFGLLAGEPTTASCRRPALSWASQPRGRQGVRSSSFGVAGLVAGAMSVAPGEYVSVSS